MGPYDGDDEGSAAVLRTVGRVAKTCRERKGLTQAESGAAIVYSKEQVSSVERGRRAPSATFLEKADEVLEAKAIEICTYANSVVHSLLQTPDYARALYGMRRPAFSEEEVERLVAARLARQGIFEEIQVMPTDREDHASLAGSLQLLRLKGGDTVGHNEVQLTNQLISHTQKVQVHKIRHGIFRAQALTPVSRCPTSKKRWAEGDRMTNPSTGNSPVPNWFKSSYSTNDGPECVEVALAPGTIHVRDSKHTWGPNSPSPPAMSRLRVVHRRSPLTHCRVDAPHRVRDINARQPRAPAPSRTRRRARSS
ncbi:Scr1 family TA system antitoxin-like transcriptional regulator [Streptomyces sp. NPDC001777]|uniref:Scr1 family TA system antitoxin-like transcriptional regulator n=1 Tax=Streptomyces sp. NPDC001777 TaxID=3364608 RepID=UPI003683CC62